MIPLVFNVCNWMSDFDDEPFEHRNSFPRSLVPSFRRTFVLSFPRPAIPQHRSKNQPVSQSKI